MGKYDEYDEDEEQERRRREYEEQEERCYEDELIRLQDKIDNLTEAQHNRLSKGE